MYAYYVRLFNAHLAIAQLVLFALVVLFVTSKFYVAIIAYLPILIESERATPQV